MRTRGQVTLVVPQDGLKWITCHQSGGRRTESSPSLPAACVLFFFFGSCQRCIPVWNVVSSFRILRLSAAPLQPLKLTANCWKRGGKCEKSEIKGVGSPLSVDNLPTMLLKVLVSTILSSVFTASFVGPSTRSWEGSGEQNKSPTSFSFCRRQPSSALVPFVMSQMTNFQACVY